MKCNEWQIVFGLYDYGTPISTNQSIQINIVSPIALNYVFAVTWMKVAYGDWGQFDIAYTTNTQTTFEFTAWNAFSQTGTIKFKWVAITN